MFVVLDNTFFSGLAMYVLRVHFRYTFLFWPVFKNISQNNTWTCDWKTEKRRPLLSKKMAVISVNPKVFTAIVATILLAYFVTSILLIISVAMVNRKINATMRALQSRLDKPRQQELYDIILQFHVPPSVRANLEEPRLPPPNLKLDSISYA